MDIVIFFQTPNALIVPVSPLVLAWWHPTSRKGALFVVPLCQLCLVKKITIIALKTNFQAKYEAMQMVFGRPSQPHIKAGNPLYLIYHDPSITSHSICFYK